MRTCFERPARVPMWIAGISLCMLAVSGIGAIVRSIPVSYANIPYEDTPSLLQTFGIGQMLVCESVQRAHLHAGHSCARFPM